jgi:hypothetical protein
MKKGKYINILYILIIGLSCGCTKYPAYEITNQPFVNSSALDMYAGDTIQLTASPADVAFKWSSDNTDIVSVSSTGLVTAVGEGLATVSVASANAETKIDVRVRLFIPLTDINLPNTSFRLYVGDKAQVWAYPVPNNASEVTFTWQSENPAIATVDRTGIITAASRGITKVLVKSGSVEKTVTVSVPELYKCDKTGWSIEVSDQTAGDGGGKDKVIDGVYDNGWWHSQWGPNVPLPHWAIIDMKKPVEVARIVTQRRNNGDTKSLQYFVGDSPDPNGTWTMVAEGAFASKDANHTLTLDATAPLSGRYLKLLLPDSFREPFTAICEVDVYGLIY